MNMSPTTYINADLCVIGGGIAGLCAAVSAARKGLKTVLIHDRSVPGGNASSEIRMWIRGAAAQFPDFAESGLIEELALDNMHYNPGMNYSLWDAVLYNKLILEKNIICLLGTTCTGAQKKDGKITLIEGWQLATYKKYEIKADFYADCSGDCIISEFTDASVMSGRESRSDYGEPFAPDESDNYTMGSSCIIQARKTAAPQRHVPFPFERRIDEKIFKNRYNINSPELERENFWWVETGGTEDTIKNADQINRSLIIDILSVWSETERKNPDLKWELDWIGFTAGKRESRRYAGDYVLTASDILSCTPFDDGIAYGGWPMDNHDPQGIYAKHPNVNYYFDRPYLIPYRCIYSSNTDNLFFAGRNISVTHLALSSTRVMATCGMIGQAVGTAAWIAKKYSTNARGAAKYIDQIKKALHDDDCYLPGSRRKTSDAIRNAFTDFNDFYRTIDSPERNIGGQDSAVSFDFGRPIELSFQKTHCDKLRFVFDSDLTRSYTDNIYLRYFPMHCYNLQGELEMRTPPSLVKDFTVVWRGVRGERSVTVKDNFQRLVLIPVNDEISYIKLICHSSYGSKTAKIFSVDII